MKDYLTQLLAKYLGPTFLTRAATSLAALLLGYLNGLDLGLEPEVLKQFGDSFGKIVAAAGSIAAVWVVDRIFAKKEEAKK